MVSLLRVVQIISARQVALRFPAAPRHNPGRLRSVLAGIVLAMTGLGLVWLLAGCGVRREQIRTPDAGSGRIQFESYCAACHRYDGTGMGQAPTLAASGGLPPFTFHDVGVRDRPDYESFRSPYRSTTMSFPNVKPPMSAASRMRVTLRALFRLVATTQPPGNTT